MTVRMDAVYVPSDDVVAREIEGELLIVPLATGIADSDDELFTLNETGRAVWARLDGKTTLQAIIDGLAGEYDVPADTIKADVVGFVTEVVRRRILVEGHLRRPKAAPAR